MFTDTLDEWIALNKRKIPLFVGLALYRAGEVSTDDPGWGRESDNLTGQLRQLREKNCGGYALFSAKDFYRKGAQKELKNFIRGMEKQ